MNEPAAIAPRPVLDILPPYAAGKSPTAVAGLLAYKLASNENPFGPVPAVQEVLSSFDQVNRYPDSLATALRESLAQHLDVPAEDIVAGAGSLGALTQIITTFAGTRPDGTQDEVIYPWRSFEAYPIVIRTAGAQDVPVPLTEDFRHDLPAMLSAITDRTRVILLCTPNNPTGPVLTTAEVEDFLAQVPAHILVVIDEAYLEFVRDEDAVDGIRMYRSHPNVAVLRTFSKAHGLANLRVGYSVAAQPITQYLRVIATPFAVSSVAERAAVASLNHLEDVMERVDTVVSERQRVVQGLTEAGWRIPQTEANFVWLPLGERTPAFLAAAEAQALSVRGFGTEGVRVTIGEVEANTRFLQLARDFGA